VDEQDQRRLEKLRTRLLANSHREGECLIWDGSKNERNGYGRMWSCGGIPAVDYVHRLSHEAFVGPIPVGLTIDHRCRVRLCIEPTHLEPVTLKVNQARRPTKGACPKGHPYTEENTLIHRRTKVCKRCHADRERDRRLNLRKISG
jgi:hypothetical protein